MWLYNSSSIFAVWFFKNYSRFIIEFWQFLIYQMLNIDAFLLSINKYINVYKIKF